MVSLKQTGTQATDLVKRNSKYCVRARLGGCLILNTQLPQSICLQRTGRQTTGCVQEGPGPLINCGHGQRAEVKEAMISTSLQVSTHRRPQDGLFRLSPPGPAVVRLLGTQPGEEQQNSLVQKRVPAYPPICSCVQLAFVTWF